MAKPHGSVRIGPISLFTLIIILCLSVLAVLSLTTARAELSITQRQADTTTETYQLESSAQRFVAQVDGALAAAPDGGALTPQALGDLLADVFADYGIAPAVTGRADGASAAAPEGEGAAAGVPEGETPAAGDAAPAGETIEDETLSATAPEDTAAGGVLLATEGQEPITVSGSFDGEQLAATFSMPSGRTLSVALRLSANGTYVLEQWKVTTQWTDDGAGENLWLG